MTIVGNVNQDFFEDSESNMQLYSTDIYTLIKLVQEIAPVKGQNKIFIENKKGVRTEVTSLELENELKNYSTNIFKVVIEKNRSGIINHYEFFLSDSDSNSIKSESKSKNFRVVTPLEEEYPIINNQYLSIKRSEKIIKMGTFFHELYKNDNIHEFGFIGTTHESCPYVVNTLIPIALYFCYHHDFTVNMILNKDNIKKACLHFGQSQSSTLEFSDREIPVSQIEKINLIDIEILSNMAKQIRRKNIFKNFYDQSKQVTLWQIPSVSAMEEKKHKYFPLFEVIENVSLVSIKGHEKSVNIQETINYFSNMNIKVLGNIWGVKKL